MRENGLVVSSQATSQAAAGILERVGILEQTGSRQTREHTLGDPRELIPSQCNDVNERERECEYLPKDVRIKTAAGSSRLHVWYT